MTCLCQNPARHELLFLLIGEKWELTSWPVFTQPGSCGGRVSTYLPCATDEQGAAGKENKRPAKWGWGDGLECLLCKIEDLSLNPQQLHKKPGVAQVYL